MTKQIFFGLILASTLLTACQSTPKPTPLYTPDITLGAAQTLTISGQRATCDSAKPMQCLIVNIDDNPEPIGIAYNAIDGFVPQAGISYRIIASPQIDRNNSNTTGKWTLVEILSQNHAYQ